MGTPGYKHTVNKDINIIRNCFEGECEYLNEKEGGGIHTLNFSQRRALSDFKIPNENIIEIDNKNVSEKKRLFNPENLNIVGFITFPQKSYLNRNINNTDNIKKLYITNKHFSKIWEENEKDKIIRKITYNHSEGDIIKLSKNDIGKELLLTLNEDDDILQEVKLINIDEDKYYFELKDEDLKSDLEEGVLDIEKDDGIIKKIEILKREMKIGDRVRTCIYQDDEYYNIEGEITEILENGIKLIPDDEELRETFSDELFPKEEIHFYDEERGLYDVCEGEKKNKIEIFLFDRIEEDITDEGMENLCNQIIPSLKEILKRKIELKNELYNSDDIEKEFFKYNITLNNIHYQEYSLLKNILETNISKFIEDNETDKKMYFSSLKDYIKKRDLYQDKLRKRNFDFVNNDEIENRNIIKCYGDYYCNNYVIDSNTFRMRWLDSRKDFGHLFYKYKVLEETRELSKKDAIEKIRNEYLKSQTELTKQIESAKSSLLKNKIDSKQKISKCNKLRLTKIYNSFNQLQEDNEKEIKYDKQFDSTPLHLKEKLVEENGPDILDSPDFVNLLKDKIKLNNDSLNEEEIDVIVSDIIEGGKKVQNGDYAFLKDGTGRIFERGIVGGSPDGMWILSSLKEIDFEQDICNQQGKNYEELEVDDLIDDDTCVYDEEHCIPNRENRMKLQIKSLQKQLESVSEDIDKISKIENFKIETQKEISILTNKNLRYKKIEENHSKNQIKKFEKLDKKYSDMKDKKKHKIFKILKKIMKDRNIVRRNINLSKLLNNRNYVREAFEEEDQDWLYILETNEKLISTHWLLKIQITLNPENSQKILQELIDKYGVYERGSEQIISRVDGDPLREIDNEIFEGFEDDDGGFKNSRGILIQEKIFSVKDIKKDLYKKGSLEYDTYNILSKVLKIIYIEMNEEDINEIVKDTKITLKSSSGLISQEEWVINELDRKITKKKIDRKKYSKLKDYKKIQDKIIEDDYQNYRIQIVLFFTVARLF